MYSFTRPRKPGIEVHINFELCSQVSSETCHLLRISRNDFFRLFDDEQPVVADLDKETKNPAPDAGP